MIKTVIFDLDGTLLNTLDTIAYYGNCALQKYGFSPVPNDVHRRFVGNGPHKLLSRLLKHCGGEDESLLSSLTSTYLDAYNKEPLYLTRPYDGITELLSGLRQRGILVGVLSNKQDEAVVKTVLHFFRGYVDFIRGSMPGVPLKPAPDAAFDAMAYLRAEKASTLFVGDTSVDIETGKNAGIRTVGCSWGFRDREELLAAGADAVVDLPAEILTLIGEENDGTSED